MRSDWTTVVPGRDAVQETARILLELARDPRDVHTGAGGMEFRIPPYLAELYNTPAEAPKPRRRARKEGDE